MSSCRLVRLLLLLLVCLLWVSNSPPSAKAESPQAPTGLRCDLLAHPEETVITTAVPEFDWIYHPSSPNGTQSGYRIIVASSQALANNETGDVWDSGVVRAADSINVPYNDTPLQGDTDYYWRVQTMDSSGESPFSAIQHFHTDAKLIGPLHSPWDDSTSLPLQGLYYNASTNYWANRYPLRFVAAAPILVTNTAPGRWFVDFGQDAFGYVTAHLNGSYQGAKVQARFGEMARGFTVDPNPPLRSNVRYISTDLTLPGGDILYPFRPPAYGPYLAKQPINPPKSFGIVMPFRYFELTNFPGTLTASDVTQERLLSEFDTNAASFDSSSPALNQVWNLCRNSMEIFPFNGIYVDGDRERLPYEADGYIHQMSAYAVDPEFTMLRYTFEFLLQHPTWPTEWRYHMIFIAWTDYLQTGNTDMLYRYYDALKPELIPWAATPNGLIKGFPDFPFSKKYSDVVDWPACERDGFLVKDGSYLNYTNSINSAFYYRSLQIMANIANVIGRSNDAAVYNDMAAKTYQSYNTVFWNNASQSYVDGVGTTHSAAHANFFPLAFGLVPPDRQAAVIKHLHSRIRANHGMPASVYGAQYLLEALFQANDTDTALGLLTANGPRSWLNMIDMGSTLTIEAWNFADKPNLDWNHPWGAAPGNLITRFVLGVRPITPGYSQILIQPHLGQSLSYVRGTIPTIRGPVSLQITNSPGLFQIEADIPGNMTATVLLPGAKNATAVVDDNNVSGNWSDGWLKIEGIGSGRHVIRLNSGNATTLSSNGNIN
jgi:alpha-L-rhamnosidase